MRIGIVGIGMVGETLKYGFERIGHDVFCYDKYKIGYNRPLPLDTDICFICVPTPSKKDDSCDTSIVEEVVKKIDENNYEGLIVIKSTVTPGTTEKLSGLINSRIAFCPEFLKEKSRYVDFVENHDVCIIGAYNKQDFDLIVEAHGSLPKRFEWLNPTEAEMAKYFSNCFNAMRIVFANQFYEVCEKIGCDYTAIKNAITKRANIGDHYLECNKNFRAFGGNCLPKDTKAFSHFANSVGAYSILWEHIVDFNAMVAGDKDETKVA